MNKEELQKFIESNSEKDIKLPMMPISEFTNLMEELGFEEGEYDSNGWQVDFWQYYEKGQNRYILSGSLFYGNFNFGKVDPKD